MRLLFIICEASAEARVEEIVEQAGGAGYTRFTDAIGHGKRGRREGSPVWPGLNSLIMTCVPDDLVSDILDRLQRLEDARSGRLAIKVFSVPAEEYL